MKRIRDPIHGFIKVRDDELRYLEEPLIQRLRRIKQLGFDHYVYPGAVHDRFSHSLGVMHNASRIYSMLSRDLSVGEDQIRLAALIHDIGHTPLSHSLERFLIEKYGVSHEAYTEAIASGLGREFWEETHKDSIAHKIISSDMDADRMDYLLRDAYYCGLKYGEFDLDRLIQGIRSYGDELVVLYKARYALQSFVLARFLMYLQVYMHKTSAGFSVAAAKIMRVIDEEDPYPSVEEVEENPNILLKYDDVWFFSHLHDLSKRDDRYGKIARQLLYRRRFKIIYQNETILPYGFRREDYPHRYTALIKHRDELWEAGGFVHAPEFVALEPPYIGKSSLPILKDGEVIDIRDINPIIRTLSENYTLLIRVYAIEGYEEAVRKKVKDLLGVIDHDS